MVVKMSDTKIFVGPRVRRIRTRLELTQTAMATDLGISPSYLNLIERNQRPLTVQLLMKLVSTFKVDVEELQPSGEAGSVTALKEVFADPLLVGELPGDTELLEISDGAPNASIGVVKLYRAYREQQGRLTDLSKLMGQAGHSIDSSGQELPVNTVRNTFEGVPWCFPALERAADRIVKDLGDDNDLVAALSRLLRSEHGITAQVLPVETMPMWRKRYDRHSKRLFLSERLPHWERVELLAQELVLLREDEVIGEELQLLKISGDEAMRLARIELARYTALAILMPYEKFLRTAERLSHDFTVLAARFDVGFGQVAQRLVSLQDKSGGRRAGMPFFMMEVDRGGHILRRLGAKGFPVSRFGGSCPKLSLHAAFSDPGQILAERVISPDGDVFLTISCTIDGPKVEAGERPRRTSVMMGVEDKYATSVMAAANNSKPKRGTIIIEHDDAHSRLIAHAKLLPSPERKPPLEIGPACRLCERQDCISRSAPPLTKPLGLDDLVQGFGAFGLT